MSAEPTPIRPMISDELSARRSRQKERGEHARDRDYDRMTAEVQACRGECYLTPGSIRGGVTLGSGQTTAGMVAVDERGGPLFDYPVLEGEHQLVRPCFDCNRERWEAWQDGQLTRRRDPSATR